MASRYVKGKYAKALCQRCGFKYKYLDMAIEPGTKILVCPDCNDGANNRVTDPLNKSSEEPDAIRVVKNPSTDSTE